ncbi:MULTISPECIES: hypothetical protein [unclassified Tatumella]|uniref:hypothetical protein n=1 Tax=unclassified Tatumella TaxID=2649542 RepID=UPI001BAE773B|nr:MULTISPECIES: hypothetical protein [unclassified Tatumella]MBS0854546.1 hypothetical protein [Tatumella sp. JGM16]MBS0911250.1 hypothetical protein [Tatumella sp. JGM91]
MFEQLPPSIYIAMGALAAALVTGLFSFLNMIVTKENKVSEFRQEWINTLREEISIFTASAQRMSYDLSECRGKNIDKAVETLNESREKTVQSLTKLTLMLNHEDIKKEGTQEFELMRVIKDARAVKVARGFRVRAKDKGCWAQDEEIIRASDAIRDAAGPLLKDNWEIVKKGERVYRYTRNAALVFLVVTFIALACFSYNSLAHTNKNVQAESQHQLITPPANVTITIKTD